MEAGERGGEGEVWCVHGVKIRTTEQRQEERKDREQMEDNMWTHPQ